LGLIVSLTCNCQLSGKLKRYQHEEPILPRLQSTASAEDTEPLQSTAAAEDTEPFGDLVEDQGGKDESDPVMHETGDSLAQPLLKNRKKGKSPKKAGTSAFAEHEII
jgi:hypothetical protein